MATENVVIKFRADGVRVVERGIGRIEKKARQAGDTAKFLKRALAFVGVGAALRSTISTLASFSQAMSTVSAVTGATSDQFKQLSDTAKELGATTRFSATQAAEGLTFLARAGFSVDEALDAIGPTLQLAQAGALDLASAADISSNILQGFRLETSETTRVVDVLAQAANSSNTNVQQLGDAMKKVAPIAAGLGVSIEEATAAIGALSNAGIQGESAGAGLVRVMAELESPSSKTVKIFKELGVNADQFKVSQVGLTQAIRVLAEAGADAGIALEAFGVRGGPAFEVMSKGVGDITDLNKKLDEAAGTAARVSEVMDANLNGALLGTKSALEAVVIAVGDLQGSGLEDFFRSLASTLRFVADNIKLVAQSVGAGLLVPALLLAKNAVIGLTLAIAANPLGFFLTAVSAGVSALVFFNDEIKVSADGITTLGDIAGPALAEILSGLQAISDFVVQSFPSVRGTLEDTFDPGFVEVFLQTIALAFDAVAGLANGLAARGFLIFDNFGTVVRSAFTSVINGLIEIINSFFRVFTQGINNMRAQLQEASRLIPGVALNFDALDILQLDTIDVAPDARDLGQALDQAMADGFNNSTAARDAIDRIFNAGREAAQQRGAEEAFGSLAGLQEQFRGGAAAPGGAAPGAGGGAESGAVAAKALAELNAGQQTQNTLLSRKGEILAQLEEQEVADIQNRTALNQLLAEGSINQEQFNELIDQMGLKMDSNQTAMDGFRESFEKIGTTANDVGAQIGDALVGAIDKASGALADFAVNGFQDIDSLKDAFADLLKDLAKQIIQIIIKTLILKAIQASLGGVPAAGAGDAAGQAVGGAAGGAALAGARAAGGPVTGGDSFLVGERGREIFTPTRSGNISPVAPESQQQQVGVTVVNVSSKEEAEEFLNSPEGQQSILNTVRTNPEAVQ